MTKNFAIIGCGGYIAPRHLQAIKEVDGTVVAALDKHDSVGILDRFSTEINFFTEFERFERFLEKFRQKNTLDYLVVCSPNYLHDAHIRLGLRLGAEVICEKPIVINPWNLDALAKIEEETGKKVNTVLQLRLHPSLIALKEKIDKETANKKHEIELAYITPRGKWYDYSWKGDVQKSGGVINNIGIHFFDMLIWLFGEVQEKQLHYMDERCASGFLELEKAKVKWYLSINKEDLRKVGKPQGDNTPYRSITIDGQELEFSKVFSDLHTQVYQEILSGKGFGIEEARASIQLVHDIRNMQVTESGGNAHPLLGKK